MVLLLLNKLEVLCRLKTVFFLKIERGSYICSGIFRKSKCSLTTVAAWWLVTASGLVGYLKDAPCPGACWQTHWGFPRRLGCLSSILRYSFCCEHSEHLGKSDSFPIMMMLLCISVWNDWGDLTSFGKPWQLNMYRKIWETNDKEDRDKNIKMGVSGLHAV